MRKLFAFLLVLSMIAGILPAFGETGADGAALPAAGDVVNGFEVKEIRPLAAFGAELVLFEHQKTGAKALYIANGDTNRVFQLTFLTRPMDDTGLPHVFEHATLYGSEKYPSKSLLFNTMFQTYNTYINAYTTDAMTCYPLASLSEEQLLRLADWYTDSCFHPSIMTDESIYKTQAWHYELADADSPLTIEGTVYSEMTGSMNLDSTAQYNANQITFPGASVSWQYGGLPAHIPEMTWDHLKAYHDLYYHPSNCVAFLYGDLDHYDAFLELLDKEFSRFEKREFVRDESSYRRIAAPVTESVPYPVVEGTDTKNHSTIIYNILCPGMKDSVETERAVDRLCSLLRSSGSPLMQNLKKALPSGTFGVGRELAAPDDAITFTAVNVNPEDAELFRATINDSLRSVMETGFEDALVDTLATQLQLTNKLASESANPVEGVIYSIAYAYAVTGNPFDYQESLEGYSHIREEAADGRFAALIGEWMLDPALYTLVSTYPAPGEKEKLDAELADRLAGIKAGMTAEEIHRIVDETAAPQEEEDNTALMASLKAVSVSDLPEEVRTYEISDTAGEDGVRRIDVAAGVDGVGQVCLYFDAGALPQEDIHYMRLYTRLLGELGTDAHSREEVSVLANRYLNSRNIGVQVDSGSSPDDVRSWLTAQWISLDEDLEAGYGLMKELLLRTRFTDTQLLSERISAQKAYVRSQINGSPYSVSLYRGLGTGLMFTRYYDYLNFTAYYAFLEDLEVKMQENPEEVVAGLQRVQTFLLNRFGAVAGFAGSTESISLNRPLADAFFADLPYEEREKAPLDLPAPAASEGLIVDTNSGFNLLVGSFAGLGVEPDEGLQVVTALVNDRLLVPILRDQMGVYTPQCGVFNEDKGMYLFTYRDPNVKETFDVYAALPDMIAQMEVDQETLDGYILKTYSGLAKPAGELTGAVSEIGRVLTGKDQNRVLNRMRQLKQVTVESVRAAADVFRALWEKGYRGTAAGAGAIGANADLYESVLNPFGAVDAGEVVLTDVPEDREDYAAIRFVYENGLMGLRGENAFGPDEDASAGDLYAALYVLLGGATNAAEEAMGMFSQVPGLVPDGTEAGTPLTFGLRDQIMSAFGTAAGIEVPAAGAGREDAVMTRGQLAADLMMFNSEE